MKKVLSIMLCLVMVLSLFAILPFTVTAEEMDFPEVGANIDSANTAAAYDMSYWQGWSQGASDYWIMRQYGCWVVAMSKMFMETGIAQSGLNPDVFYWWERNNGWLPNNDNNLNQIDGYNAPVAYANSQGKILEAVAQNWSVNDSVLWSYINNDYYTIIQVSDYQHYVYIDNYRSKLTGEIYIMESFTDSNYAGSYSLHSRYSGVARAMTYRYVPAPEYQASIPKGQDGVYKTDEDVVMSVNADSGDTCWLEIWHTPVGGTPYAYWNGSIPSNSYTRKFEEVGYYSCHFSVAHGGTTYGSKWVGWYVVPAFHATTDKGAEGSYERGETVIIGIDSLDFVSGSLHIYYTPVDGTTSLYLSCEATKEPMVFQFEQEGHYSCFFRVEHNTKTVDSKWVGWDVVNYNGLFPTKSVLYNNHRYELFEGNITWKQAKDFCEKKGGHLAYIETANENEALIAFASGLTDYVWVGASDEDVEGFWYWTNGDEYSFTNWYSGEPNNTADDGGSENYLQLIVSGAAKGKWNDAANNSSKVNGFICEYDNISILGDTDGDGDVSSIDATYILRYTALIDVQIDEDVLMHGDVDGNEELEVVDATYIQRYLAEFPIPYSIGEPIA